MTSLTFTVPMLPPSGNNYVRHSRGRHYRTQAAHKFDEAVMVFAQNRSVDGDTYDIWLQFQFKNLRRRDIDNLMKCSLDALVRNAVIEDDSQVERIVIQRYYGETEQVTFTITGRKQ